MDRMRVKSPAFLDGEWIPVNHSIDGSELLVPLEFDGVPKDAVSLAIVVHDPDVPRDRRPDGNFDHWVVWNIPPSKRRLSDSCAHGGVVGHHQPRGHRYFFTVYAVDTMLELPNTAGRGDLERAIAGHTLDRTVLMGRFERH
jgi:phosphatidylethanolamine-binding protein (PEBP) family uncharacterized protein